jgi:hypothetical protein
MKIWFICGTSDVPGQVVLHGHFVGLLQMGDIIALRFPFHFFPSPHPHSYPSFLFPVFASSYVYIVTDSLSLRIVSVLGSEIIPFTFITHFSLLLRPSIAIVPIFDLLSNLSC